jgi:hypothetical protein
MTHNYTYLFCGAEQNGVLLIPLLCSWDTTGVTAIFICFHCCWLFSSVKLKRLLSRLQPTFYESFEKWPIGDGVDGLSFVYVILHVNEKIRGNQALIFLVRRLRRSVLPPAFHTYE